MRAPVLLHRHQIDDVAWNALIDRSPHLTIYAYTWYLDVVSPGWKGLTVDNSIADSDQWTANSTQDTTGDLPNSEKASGYFAVMPLPIRKKWGLTTLQQPLFCQYLGIFSGNTLSTEKISAFLGALGRHFSYISDYAFHPLQANVLQKALVHFSEFHFVEKTTHWLDLDSTYAQIAARYKIDRRNNLKRSIKKGWQIIISTDARPLLSLFRDNHAPKIQGVKEYAFPLFSKLAEVLLKQKKAKIQYVMFNGEIRAGVMFLENNGTGIYIFNAADAIGRQGNARTFLLDQYFQQAAGALHTFDFESPEAAGIARFYESFGAEKRVFISIKKNKLPFPLRQLQEWRKWIHRAK